MNQFISEKETLKASLIRWGFNLSPVYRRTGGRVRYVSPDWKKVRVELKRRLATRNYVGTVFGGSIYSSTDPIYMIMLMQILGKSYVVWDKAACVKFRKPIMDKVFADFEITDEFLASVKEKVANKGEADFDLPVQYKDDQGKVFAEISKTLYVADKAFYKQKAKRKSAKK